MTVSSTGYKIISSLPIERGDLVIRAVGLQDIERIRQWRNAQMNVLRQSSPITSEEQERYFTEHVWPEMKADRPKQILLAIENNGELVGYGGLVNISWIHQRSEVSFLLNPEIERNINQRSMIFLNFLETIKEVAFQVLQHSRIWTETYSIRTYHIKALEDAGFQMEGCLRNHVIINGKSIDSIVHGFLRKV